MDWRYLGPIFGGNVKTASLVVRVGQTHRPFDGITETELDPLELVSFNLWGPSRVQSGGGEDVLHAHC